MSTISENDKALVLLSGGQDSVTCLGLALKVHKEVEAIAFYYGQKHAVELQSASVICQERGVHLELVDISNLFNKSTSALLSDSMNVSDSHPMNKELPASYVPNRNATFLTVAHSYAQKVGAKFVYTGACQTDYSGYPDCREDFVKALFEALNLGSAVEDIVPVTPLMWLTKAQTFAIADACGFLKTVVEDTHTCYNGERSTLHEWGYGCGECPACLLRKKGYEEFKAKGSKALLEKTVYEELFNE